MGYLFIAGCIFFTVYGQLILKWRINQVSGVPETLMEKAVFLIMLILKDPFVLSGFLSAFIASIFWMAAMTRFAISFAYPFMSLAFVLVMVGSSVFFNEAINAYKIAGTIVVILGLVILSRGY